MDAYIHFGKALFATTFELMSLSILTSIYHGNFLENDNNNEDRERTMQVPKHEKAAVRERVFQIPTYQENKSYQVITFDSGKFIQTYVLMRIIDMKTETFLFLQYKIKSSITLNVIKLYDYHIIPTEFVTTDLL